MKCKYCKKEIHFAYWQGYLMAREFNDNGSKTHFCDERFIRFKKEKKK
jgi:hypothetical protein